MSKFKFSASLFCRLSPHCIYTMQSKQLSSNISCAGKMWGWSRIWMMYGSYFFPIKEQSPAHKKKTKNKKKKTQVVFMNLVRPNISLHALLSPSPDLASSMAPPPSPSGGLILRFKREGVWLRLKESKLGQAHLFCRCSPCLFCM
jgi:hypothetical protein